MALFDSVIDDMASKFGLGANTAPLMRESLALINGSPGGISGFLKRFTDAGLGSEVASWVGHPDAPALNGSEVERVLGSSTIGGIANRLGVGQAAAAAALGYALPKVMGLLTPNGAIPTSLPAEATNLLSGAPSRREVYPDQQAAATYVRPEQVAPRRIDVYPRAPVVQDEPALTRWLWPLLAALGVLGLALYFWPTASTPPAIPVAQAPAPPPAPGPTLAPPQLSITNDDGNIRYSGVVHDEETRNAIVNALKSAFGADRVSGDISVDLNRAAAPWLVNFRNAVESLKTPGVQAAFDGNSVNIGGLVNNADRDRIMNSLKGVLGGGLVFGTLAERASDMISNANATATTALASLKPGFSANDLTAVLNQSIINFPSGSAEIPANMTSFLQSAAVNLKQLGRGTVIEIAGYTDNSGDPGSNVTLSQQRADAVRNALIKAGVDPAMVVAKGYGSSNPIASNDLAQGRFRNRRIEYHVLKTS